MANIVRINGKAVKDLAAAADIEAINTEIGNLADLDTTDKSSLVAAINEAAQSGGGGGGAVNDVKVNGNTVVTDGIANVPLADTINPGVVRIPSGTNASIDIHNGTISVRTATPDAIKYGTNDLPIGANVAKETAFYGLASAAGDTSQKQSVNPVGTYTANAKQAIKTMLGITDVTSYNALNNKPSINGVTLSGNSTLPNLGIASAADVAAKYTKPSDGIPKSDLASAVQTSLDKADTALQTAPVASVAGKTGVVTLDAGDVEYDDTDTYATGTVGAGIADLKSELDSRINFLAFEQGTLNTVNGAQIDNQNYIRSITKITSSMTIDTGSSDFIIAGVFAYSALDGSFDSYTGVGVRKVDISPESGTYVRITVRRSNTMAIVPADIQPDMTITNLFLASRSVSANTECLMDTKIITGEYIDGYGVTSSVSTGTIVNDTPVANAFVAYIIVPCKYQDKFTLTGTGGTVYRLWCFTDKNYRSLAVSAASATASNLELIAPEDGYFISNVIKADSYSLQVIQRVDGLAAAVHDVKRLNGLMPEYVHITDPHKLNWVMKSFNANGVGSALYSDRMCTWCKVKAGSTIKPTVYGGNVKVSFGYKLDDSQVSLDSYTSYGYSTYTVEQDCTIYIGVVNKTATYLFNDSILDGITIDLDVVDYVSKYSKKDAGAFGNPIDVYYEGQHTDETGWTNDTVDVDAIHTAFDALVTAGDGYLSKTDLGIAYDTYHMYKYDTFPVPANHGLLKVPKVAIICCEHGNEKMSVYAVHYLLHDLIHKATKNPVLSYLRSNCKLSVIPIANPWGFINTSRWNENGVNLNRNFPTYNWSEYSDETSGQGGINYKGESAGSEDQTKLIMAFLRANYDAVFAIDLHTNGTNTSNAYEICATIIPETPDVSSADYVVQHSYVLPARTHINRIKPWLDETYGSNGVGASYYGSIIAPEPDRPTTAQWIRESNNMMGFTFEVLCGSSDGYLGPTLTKYAPATIKAAAEELGNFLVAMLINCKNT